MDNEDCDDSWEEPQTPPNFRTLNCCGNCKHSGRDCEHCNEFFCEIAINTVCDFWRKDPRIKNER